MAIHPHCPIQNPTHCKLESTICFWFCLIRDTYIFDLSHLTILESPHFVFVWSETHTCLISEVSPYWNTHILSLFRDQRHIHLLISMILSYWNTRILFLFDQRLIHLWSQWSHHIGIPTFCFSLDQRHIHLLISMISPYWNTHILFLFWIKDTYHLLISSHHMSLSAFTNNLYLWHFFLWVFAGIVSDGCPKVLDIIVGAIGLHPISAQHSEEPRWILHPIPPESRGELQCRAEADDRGAECHVPWCNICLCQ